MLKANDLQSSARKPKRIANPYFNSPEKPLPIRQILRHWQKSNFQWAVRLAPTAIIWRGFLVFQAKPCDFMANWWRWWVPPPRPWTALVMQTLHMLAVILSWLTMTSIHFRHARTAWTRHSGRIACWVFSCCWQTAIAPARALSESVRHLTTYPNSGFCRWRRRLGCECVFCVFGSCFFGRFCWEALRPASACVHTFNCKSKLFHPRIVKERDRYYTTVVSTFIIWSRFAKNQAEFFKKVEIHLVIWCEKQQGRNLIATPSSSKWYSERESNPHHDLIRVLSDINRLH